jgi:hypothetical protein
MKAQLKSDLNLQPVTINERLYYIAPIPDFPKWYASTCGLIISTKRKEIKVLKGVSNRNGYRQVKQRQAAKYKMYSVHRLVALTFYDFDDIDYEGRDRKEVNHIDGNRANNKVTNLEFCSRSENMMHARHVLKAADRVPMQTQKEESK